MAKRVKKEAAAKAKPAAKLTVRKRKHQTGAEAAATEAPRPKIDEDQQEEPGTELPGENSDGDAAPTFEHVKPDQLGKVYMWTTWSGATKEEMMAVATQVPCMAGGSSSVDNRQCSACGVAYKGEPFCASCGRKF
jgi:hypothetical protein